MAGITPIAASELEPFPIRVTTKRFPQMLHLGDVGKIDGGKIPPVDVITFGSPCQDLSIANAGRKGLEGGRSGLFMEAARIVREMRQETDGCYPTFTVWENVPGAFSSNGGEDFRRVLEETAKAADPAAVIPRPPGGQWKPAGEVLGDGWSLAWRTLDAQYWGVPQRRRRIFLVMDFGGGRAGKILFERESLLGHPGAGPGQGQGTAPEAQGGLGSAVFRGMAGAGAGGIAYSERVSPTLETDGNMHYLERVLNDRGGNIIEAPEAVENHQQDGRVKLAGGTVQTLSGKMGAGGNNVPLVLATIEGNGARPSHNGDGYGEGNVCYTLNTVERHAVAYEAATYRVRRLTPLETCRLQGFPDWWTDGLATENPADEEIEWWQGVFLAAGKPKTANQARKWLRDPYSAASLYKMWGNSIAIPCAYTIMAGIADELADTKKIY